MFELAEWDGGEGGMSGLGAQSAAQVAAAQRREASQAAAAARKAANEAAAAARKAAQSLPHAEKRAAIQAANQAKAAAIQAANISKSTAVKAANTTATSARQETREKTQILSRTKSEIRQIEAKQTQLKAACDEVQTSPDTNDVMRKQNACAFIAYLACLKTKLVDVVIQCTAPSVKLAEVIKQLSQAKTQAKQSAAASKRADAKQARIDKKLANGKSVKALPGESGKIDAIMAAANHNKQQVAAVRQRANAAKTKAQKQAVLNEAKALLDEMGTGGPATTQTMKGFLSGLADELDAAITGAGSDPLTILLLSQKPAELPAKCKKKDGTPKTTPQCMMLTLSAQTQQQMQFVMVMMMQSQKEMMALIRELIASIGTVQAKECADELGNPISCPETGGQSGPQCPAGTYSDGFACQLIPTADPFGGGVSYPDPFGGGAYPQGGYPDPFGGGGFEIGNTGGGNSFEVGGGGMEVGGGGGFDPPPAFEGGSNDGSEMEYADAGGEFGGEFGGGEFGAPVEMAQGNFAPALTTYNQSPLPATNQAMELVFSEGGEDEFWSE